MTTEQKPLDNRTEEEKRAMRAAKRKKIEPPTRLTKEQWRERTREMLKGIDLEKLRNL